MKPIHVIVVLVVVLILFGAPKLPEFARSLGKSLRILKEEAKALTSDDDSSKPMVEDEANDK
ncbi:Sec-independent protein translocase subunit TatA [Demequina lutea]|uniref:Sec-independent protein translocase protein TatA n=1 Tax=Demequina lutea TaxID=431489 RepID=A0A7Y9ZCC8_9MICO|nr:Sec-independent protein translocase subunit TatA [Demequina lutea]NYI41395.1 sec-independent protein translocase protein TatA [Demequina lutea]